jgi:hypothetical protein
MHMSPGPGVSRTARARERSIIVAVLIALVTPLIAVSGVAAASPQAITFTLPASGSVGSTVELTATADSGLSVSFTSDTTDVCTVAATTLSLVAAGTCTVTASQAGDGTFAPATDVDASTIVAPAPPDPTPQAITFALPASGSVGSTVELTATADSGLAVSYSTSMPDVCTVTDTHLGLVAAGTCTVTASQAGDGTFAPATDVVASMTVSLAPPDPSPQSITFSLPATGFVGSTVELTATADSGLSVSFTSDTTDVCTVAATTLSLVAAGTCTVTASQAGDGTFAPATDVVASTIVAPAPQTITFLLPASGLSGSKVKLAATAGSRLAVSYASTTLGTCTVVGALVSLTAAGTCTVTASQAGNVAWAAAPDVPASMAVQPVAAGVDLGKYAVNGTVRAVVTDAATGRTYLGGDFTQIGLRTGPVAVVNPPDVGAGDLLASSPEVLGTVKAVFADDRPGDPGFFIVGELLAVNGNPVPAVPVTRMHLNAGGTKWVVDTAWAVTNPSDCTIFSGAIALIATDDYLVAGYATDSASTTGFWTIDRQTGVCSTATEADIPVLPSLANCASLMYCQATVNRFAWDRASNRLLVWYTTSIGASPDSVTGGSYLASYNLAATGGGRLWNTAIAGDRPTDATQWSNTVSGIATVGSRVLVGGMFPFEAEDGVWPADKETVLLALDAETGAITQRWNTAGEQSVPDGSPLGSASPCFTSRTMGAFVDLAGESVRWLALGWPTSSGQPSMLCSYSDTEGSISAARVGDLEVTMVQAWELPSTSYTAPGGATYLVGPYMAVAMATATVASWHPDAGTAPNTPLVSIAISTAGVIISGDFTFVRGTASPGVVALTSSLSPDPGFVSPLPTLPVPTSSWPGVNALALDEGWLLVGGFFRFPTAPGAALDARSIVALDPSSGDVLDWPASSQSPSIADTIAVNPGNGEFWVGGSSLTYLLPATSALARYAAPTDGATSLPAPSIACLDASSPNLIMYTPVCEPSGNGGSEVRALAFDSAGRLYAAGAFGSVDGQVRRGLARLDATGAPDAWNPDLLRVVPIPDGSYLYTLVPHSLAVLDNRLLVGGSFCSITPRVGGGGGLGCVSPLLVFSTETGALLRPTDPAVSPWFTVFGWWSAGYSILASDTGVVVALGDVGVAVFDPVTLDFDPAASAPFLSGGWWGHSFRDGVFAMAVPAAAVGSSGVASVETRATRVASAEVPATRVVFAGSISRWGDHVAGNMASADISSTPDYTLIVSRNGSGSGTVTSGSGAISCGSTCAAVLASGTSIGLTARPAAGSSFSGWTGGGCSGTTPCTVTISGPTTVSATFVAAPVDSIAPTATAPGATLHTGVPLSGTSIPIHLGWSGADTGGTGINHYELARSTNGGTSWTAISSALTTASADVTVASSGTVRFRVRAIDGAGNVGAWATGLNLTPRLTQQSSTAIHYRGTWTNSSSSLLSGGSAKYAKAVGSYATFTFTGRSIALVATTASTRGKVRVYVNGVLVATVDLRSSATRYRVLAWQKTWTTSATRTIKLVVVGAAGRPRVDLDAFATLK